MAGQVHAEHVRHAGSVPQHVTEVRVVPFCPEAQPDGQCILSRVQKLGDLFVHVLQCRQSDALKQDVEATLFAQCCFPRVAVSY